MPHVKPRGNPRKPPAHQGRKPDAGGKQTRIARMENSFHAAKFFISKLEIHISNLKMHILRLRIHILRLEIKNLHG